MMHLLRPSCFLRCYGRVRWRRTICEISYRYNPKDIGALKAERAISSSLYVIGGLYGSLHSLDAILKMACLEKEPPQLIFNGDFNFFNCKEEDFIAINNIVKLFTATKGNIEDVISKPKPDSFECGCDYPSSVSTEYIKRSNKIAERLHGTAHSNQQSEIILQFLRELPMCRRIKMSSGHIIGILHGDAHSLSGWNFSYENLLASSADAASHWPSSPALSSSCSSPSSVMKWLNEAKCDIFACTHTCLPVMVDYDNHSKAIVNNGSAGIPNFKEETFGVITRISEDVKTVPQSSLYSTTLSDCIRIDAIAVCYDHKDFCSKFLVDWPEGSPGYVNYYERLVHGTTMCIQDSKLRL